MAKREENIKKINAELEKLSDEELDKVAGGTCNEIADDSRFLNSLNGSCDRYGAARIFFEAPFVGSPDEEVKKAWAKLGITAEFEELTDNRYYLNGQQITQEQARQHAMNVTGHHMPESEWKW